MSMYKLDPRMQEMIAEDVGIPFEEIAGMDCEDIDTRIESKIGKKLGYKKNDLDERLNSRGSMYLALDRLLDIDDIDERIKNL